MQIKLEEPPTPTTDDIFSEAFTWPYGNYSDDYAVSQSVNILLEHIQSDRTGHWILGEVFHMEAVCIRHVIDIITNGVWGSMGWKYTDMANDTSCSLDRLSS